ncbi:exopolyphosphatase, partial [Streptomyces sp. NPDC089799]
PGAEPPVSGRGGEGESPAGRSQAAPAPGHVRAPLGAIAGARSGDKGGDANVGVWVESDEAYAWLAATLTAHRLQELLPETRGLVVTRHALPHLRALNFTVAGVLGAGVAAGHRFDPQAKALGEWLRARHLDIPGHLLAGPLPADPGHLLPGPPPAGPDRPPAGPPPAGPGHPLPPTPEVSA